MTKLIDPLLSFDARGRIGKLIALTRRQKVNIAEKMPIPSDPKSGAQLSWRHMFQKVIALWHLLSASEKMEWESSARRHHMTGYAYFLSQALRPNPGIYLPLQGGIMAGDIDMAKHRLLKLPLPTDPQEAARLADLGAQTFLDLNDTPADYTGKALRHVRVNATEDTLQFVRNIFLTLLDTPGSYAGQALKVARVNAAQNALEFATITGGYTEGARVYHNTNQAIGNITMTVLAFNTELWDTDTIHDNAVNNNRLTCKTAGKYFVSVCVKWDTNVAGYRELNIVDKESNIVVQGHDGSCAGYRTQSVSTIQTLAVNDWLEIRVRQTSGAALNVLKTAHPYSPHFMMQRIG